MDVATPYAAPAPAAEYTRMLLPATGEVVERPVPPPVELIVIGEAPIAVKAVQVVLPEQETEVVATCPNFAGVPEVVVQYGRNPAISFVEVPTVPLPPDDTTGAQVESVPSVWR